MQSVEVTVSQKAVILVQSVNANNAICNISKGVTYMEKATKLIQDDSAIQPNIYHGVSKENLDATTNSSESLLLFSQITFRKFMLQIVAIFSTKQKCNSIAQLVAPAYRFRSSKDQYHCVTSYEPELQLAQFRSLLTMNASSRVQKNRGIPKT